ncbi:luciferase [Devosia limi DSM 17137]|nr:MupA/Atu3671 family FMN-dependent luciferase-like monooxygenase [Devosia limi]KKB80718.1 luciferase [Devosia limi DSM 17137]
MNKSAVVLVGNESLLVQCAEILLERGHEIVGVVSDTAPIIEWAESRGIAATGWTGDLVERLGATPFDWLFSIANLRILPDALLALPRTGAINFHDGLLPRYAGLNTPSWALIENADMHGVTWHIISGEVDTGDILVQKAFEIAADETVLTLNAKCFEAGMASFGEVLDGIETGSLAPSAQDFSTRQYYARDQRPDALGTLDFNSPGEELSRLVRALSFGDGYANPLVTPKVFAGGRVFGVTGVEIIDQPAYAQPGSVIRVADDVVFVATGDGSIGLRTEGDAAGPLAQSVFAGMRIGLDDGTRQALTEAAAPLVASEPRQRRRLSDAIDIDLALINAADGAAAPSQLKVTLPTNGRTSAVISAFLARLAAQPAFSLAYANDGMRELGQRFPGYFSASVPLNIKSEATASTHAVLDGIAASVDKLRADGPYLADIFARRPGLVRPRLSLGILETSGQPELIAGCAATFAFAPEGQDITLVFDSQRLSQLNAARLVEWLGVFAEALVGADQPLMQMPIMSANELHDLLYGRNDTALDYERNVCVHQLIERQVDRTPDAIAVVYGKTALTYRQLDSAANKLAHALIARGVGPDSLVGIHLARSVEMVVAVLGVHKAGGAYVPLDPDFPADRIAYMVEDSRAVAVVTDMSGAGALAVAPDRLIAIEDVLAGPECERPAAPVTPSNLAYVIYTSGSTGRPKGVMVEHGNVVNFFAGMDQRLPVDPAGDNVWLAVTSLSFDISVLELCWTLTRGFKVVLHARASALAAQNRTKLARPIEFGLFYWGNDDGVGPAKYELLLEGSKIADRNGFTSVWTPERHFGAFGGPYPNPAVTGAAVAAVTKNLSIRAGSCVLPLHHPARVAEEWAVIDNISNGRVALAFASGWMPEDFVLRPENAPPNNKAALVNDIDTVRRLWRGESVPFKMGDTEINVVTQPRPIQKELPIWVTTAGNPETYREAARQGANVLTHLLGQSVEELAGKIKLYRDTLTELGRNPADYKVTLMLHTLLGDDREAVRELAREPMKDYLRSATALIKQYAWAFPAFKKPAGLQQPMDIDLRSLDEAEMDGILDFAFQRYFEDSGLFGTVEDGLRRIAEVTAIGVDEVACLIDFGVPTRTVLESLVPLSDLVARTRQQEDADEAPTGLAAEIARHGVTHLQCTPSMAMLFLSEEADRQALGAVQHLFIGGEALHGRLVKDLRASTAASIENMYGPTETTIWSSTITVDDTDGVVPIGTPIANTQLYVLDANQRPVPAGMPGELYIAGDGVARGYYQRPDLTESRFQANPFAAGRMYRTGDLVSIDPGSGDIMFLGRTDFQVKVRGYRIELGEIESAIGSFPGIREAVVVAQADNPADVRLVGYVRLTAGELDEVALRAHLANALPSYMVPSHFMVLKSFPLTPNMKVDRKRLPAPVAVTTAAPTEERAPLDNDAQRTIAAAFQRALGLPEIGLNDNFFALGGHSLLAVHVHRELKASLAPDLAITDLFRYPTVAALALRIADAGKPDERLSGAAQRAAARRAAMDRRSR